jgi:hypothetical protein
VLNARDLTAGGKLVAAEGPVVQAVMRMGLRGHESTRPITRKFALYLLGDDE